MKIIRKGHIKRDKTGLALCGVDPKTPVKETSLYGKLCPDCYEIASALLQGETFKEDA
jgi:hypothetical protein